MQSPREKIEEREAEAKAAQAEARARDLSLANDFKEVFGTPRLRSEAQARVLAHLREKAGGLGSAFRPQGEGDGVKILLAGIQRDGARSVVDLIDYQMEKAGRPPRKPKAPPRVKR